MSSTALVQTPQAPNQLQRTTSSSSGVARFAPKPAVTPQPNAIIRQSDAPKQSTPQQHRPSPAPSTPGRWEHPRMAEIIKRQNATNFDQNNVKRILLSVGCMIAVFVLPSYVAFLIPRSTLQSLRPWDTWASVVTQILLAANITLALFPLFRVKDGMEDIPLTPQQRRLLDLPPLSRPATPQEQAAWVTPPRYSRSATPGSLDSLHVNARGSPLSGRGSPFDGFLQSPSPALYNTAARSGNASPFGNSPLTGKTLDSAGPRRRRGDSLGSTRSSFGESDVFGTPIAKGSRASVGLNSKWLYEKGKVSPVAAGMIGNGWGTGSVFN